MKKISLFLFVTTIAVSGLAQKQSIKWGEEFKLKKGSTNLTVVHSDYTGVYLQEEHFTMKSYFVVGASYRESASLVKLDKNLMEIYRTDFNQELRGKEFVQFFPFKDKLLIIASENIKSERKTQLYGAEVNRSNGRITESWKPITSFQKEEKKDAINFRIIPNVDTSSIVVISNITGKGKQSYQVQEFDRNLKPNTKTATISQEFEENTYQLEDVMYTTDKKIVLVGRVFEYQEGKKKKERFLDFVNYSIRIYDKNGKQENEINTNINGKWLNSTKLMLGQGRELILASFYSTEKKGKTTDGLLVQRIDAQSGKVISTSEKAINNSLLSTDNGETDADDDNDKDSESKEEKKERQKFAKLKDEGEGFSKHMKFRNIFYTPDGGLLLLAEYYHFFTYVTRTSSPSGRGSADVTYTTYLIYECGDIMMAKIDATDNIAWLQVVPKAQREVLIADNYNGLAKVHPFFIHTSRPFYAGFGAMQTASGIQIYFNDSPKNADVVQPGKKLKKIVSYGKTDFFMIALDQITGKFQRKSIFSNNDIPTPMPRLGSVIGNEMYIVGKTDRYLGKSKIQVGKISSK